MKTQAMPLKKQTSRFDDITLYVALSLFFVVLIVL